MIPILIGDTCQPRARENVVFLPQKQGFVAFADLLSNDQGCSTGVRNPVSVRLEVVPHSGPKSIVTQFGILKDSLDGSGNPSFYYKKTNPVSFADTTQYFMAEGPNTRVSVGRLIIK